MQRISKPRNFKTESKIIVALVKSCAYNIHIMLEKKIGKSFLYITIALIAAGCTMQKPTAQAPTYNITITDNSQNIIGDGNTPSLAASTSTEQVAKPQVSSDAKSTTSNAWILLIIAGIAVTVLVGWLAYKKYGKWWTKLF